MIKIRTLSVKQNLGCLTASAEVFAQQILGNYTLACLSITAKDLIHLALMPYEIWQEHTHATAILNEDVSIRQAQKAEFVNQLINRLAMFQSTRTTYQNQVFIEAALRKLGIRGQKDFLRAALQSINLDEATSGMLKTYREKLDVLQEMADKAKKKTKRKKQSQDTVQGRRLYLQDAIFARLNVPSIIRELGRQRNELPDAIVQAQIMKMADIIELSAMRNRISRGKLQSNMERMNPYEWGRFASGNVVKETVEGKLSAAVLMNLVTGAALCTAEKRTDTYGGNMRWRNLVDNFSRGSRDTIERFFMYHKSMQTTNFEMQKSLLEATSEGFEKETKILRNIEENTRKAELIETLEETWLHSKTIRKMLDARVEKKLTGLWISSMEETEKQTAIRKRTLHVETTNIHREFSEQNIKEINRLVKTHIQSQMDVMTDKVYGKMENRLLSERKRRGL